MTHTQAIAKAHAALDLTNPTAATCPWRPTYHFAPPSGWINDPNGLIEWPPRSGQYHLFYQHYPYAPKWGPMHWGHAVSTDLVRWKHLPIALAPTEPFELSDHGCGCFSGSAIDHQGELALLYTAHATGRSPVETQCLATSRDGLTFTKHPANPVIPALPPDGSNDFRDPKVWRHEGHYYCIVGTKRDKIGKAVLYRSDDLVHWDYLGVAAESDGTLGDMWECPDLFELDGKHVLLFSTGLGRPLSMYLVGHLDYATAKFTIESRGLIDHGPDFYAPQTFLDSAGRRIMIAWMQAWGATIPTEANAWSGAMTVARELHLANGKLLQLPARELTRLRTGHTPLPKSTLQPGTTQTLPISGDSLELMLRLHCPGTATLRLRSSTPTGTDAGDHQSTLLHLDGPAQTLTLDRTHSGPGNPGQYSAPISPLPDGTFSLPILLDRSSVEVFSATGETALTARIYPDPTSTALSLTAASAPLTLLSADLWRLQ